MRIEVWMEKDDKQFPTHSDNLQVRKMTTTNSKIMLRTSLCYSMGKLQDFGSELNP